MGAKRVAWNWLSGLAIFVALTSAGCRNIFDPDPPITVEIFNNSDFEVLPDIRFDFDESIPAGAAEGFLDIGELLPGEFVQYDFDCSELGLIFSDETEVYFFGQFFGVAERSFVARYGLDFLCGDFIVIEFQGNPDDDFFDTLIFVNDVLIN